jgi:hypothetical protein
MKGNLTRDRCTSIFRSGSCTASSMVEQLTLNQLVEGSSPSRCTRNEKGRSANSVPLLFAGRLLLQAVAMPVEAVAEFVAPANPVIPNRPDREVNNCRNHTCGEDQPEIPGSRVRIPEVRLRAEVEKCRKQLRDCHRYLLSKRSHL